MAFSDNLQYIRAQAGITQEQLAEQLDVSRQSVSKWESGTSFPEMDTLLRICDLYHVNLDTLLRGSVKDSQVTDTAQYDSFMNRFSRRMALAIGAYPGGVSVMLLTDALFSAGRAASIALYLLIVAASTVVVVASVIQYGGFRKRYPIIADFYTQADRDAFQQKYPWFIAGGVGAILFGVALLVLSDALAPDSEFLDLLMIGLFMLIVGGAVASFIYGGMQKDKYAVWKYNRDNNPDPAAKKRLEWIDAACGAVMLLATAAYLFQGFTRGAWSTAWWVFPIGGILCGGIRTVLDPYRGED